MAMTRFTRPVSGFSLLVLCVTLLVLALSVDAAKTWQVLWPKQTEGLNILAGDTVVWTNSDDSTPPVVHTVTSEFAQNGFDSQDLAPGQTFSHTFYFAQNLTYTCIHHNETSFVFVNGASSLTAIAILAPVFAIFATIGASWIH